MGDQDKNDVLASDLAPDLNVTRRERGRYIRVVGLARVYYCRSSSMHTRIRQLIITILCLKNDHPITHSTQNNQHTCRKNRAMRIFFTSQHRGSSHHSQTTLFCPHFKAHESTSSSNLPYCSQCLPPTFSAGSDPTGPKLKGQSFKNLQSGHQERASSHNDPSWTEQPAQRFSPAYPSQYSQISSSNPTMKAPSSVPMERTLPAYRPLDAWINTSISGDPWTTFKAFDRLQIGENRSGDTRNGNTSSNFENQSQSDSSSPTAEPTPN